MTRAILKKLVYLRGGHDDNLDFPIQAVSFTEKTKRMIEESGVEEDVCNLVSCR